MHLGPLESLPGFWGFPSTLAETPVWVETRQPESLLIRTPYSVARSS